VLNNEEIQEVLDAITYQPNGGTNIEFFVSDPEPGINLDSFSNFCDPVVFSMEPWLVDSRNWDFYFHWGEDCPDEESPSRRVGPVGVTRICDRPRDSSEVKYQVAELVAYFAAHEALEWLWDSESKELVHDPHNSGDVTVNISQD
jgi:hypothetical protein